MSRSGSEGAIPGAAARRRRFTSAIDGHLEVLSAKISIYWTRRNAECSEMMREETKIFAAVAAWDSRQILPPNICDQSPFFLREAGRCKILAVTETSRAVS